MTRLVSAAAWTALMTVALVLGSVSSPPAGQVQVSESAMGRNGWTNVTNAVSPPAVGGGMMAYDSKADLFVLFGGSDGNPTNGTWTLDPKTATWNLLHPAVSPPARVDGMFAYDSQADAFVLFGGWQEPADEVYARLGDTWIFYVDNETWVPRQPFASPPARSDAAVAYDPQDDFLLMFGGFNGTAYRGDAWRYEFNANTWVPVVKSVMPTDRADGRMTYDPSTRGFYLFGGNDYSGPNFTFHHLNDTWRFVVQGHTWTQLATSVSPGARDYAVFAADTGSGQLLSLGGFGNGTVLGELWAFNTTELDWRNLTAPGGPSPRMAAVGGYTPIENLYVIFSGGDKVSAKDDTWFYRFPGPLTASITASSVTPNVDTLVTFHAKVLGGSGVYGVLQWSFGDGGNGTGPDPSHPFTQPGVYTIRFRAADDMNDVANVTMQITVGGGIPVALDLAILVPPTALIIAAVYWVARRRRDPPEKPA